MEQSSVHRTDLSIMETSIDRGGLDGPVGKYNSMSPNGKKKKIKSDPYLTPHTRENTHDKRLKS